MGNFLVGNEGMGFDFVVFSLSHSIYCINCIVQQSRLVNYVLCIESFSSNGLFKQFLMVSSLCLTLELMGGKKATDLGGLMQLKQRISFI